PIAGMTHAVVLLLVLVVLMPFAAWIPMPVIAAILFMVAYNMSEWRRFVHICKTASLGDILVLVATFVLTVVFDLVVAIVAGLILTCVLFMKKMADSASARTWDRSGMKDIPEGVMVYEINGPLFFAATDKLLDLPRDDGLKVLILRASNLQYMDSSAIHSLEKLVADAREDGVTLVFSHVHDEPLVRLRKAGLYDAIGEENFCLHIDDALTRAEAILAEENK
ncbi:MAG: STAS domain-containing protein, partial [Clostridia bacterium]|nr:STAS domain-containing protein [Clostridia bacterium]